MTQKRKDSLSSIKENIKELKDYFNHIIKESSKPQFEFVSLLNIYEKKLNDIQVNLDNLR